MTLLKTSLLNAIAVAIKMLSMLGINKILAIYVGPSGYAVIGQFQNAIQMVTTFGGGAISNGVTKYTAEYHCDKKQQRKLWQTAGTISLLGSVTTGTLILLFSERLAVWFLQDNKYSSIFFAFGITLSFFTFNTLLLAILNGKKEIKKYVLINIAGSLFSMAASAAGIISLGLFGALLALAVNQSIVFFITLTFCSRSKWFSAKRLIGHIDKSIAFNLAKFTAMALISAVAMPLSQMLVRNHLGQNFGWQAAGYWEAMWRLSAAYLMFITSTLSVYYLPRLSEIKEYHEIKTEVINGYKIILPFAAASAGAIYVCRDPIILLLFSKEFQPMRELFAWQMLGDTFKIGSWILAFVMLGQAMTKTFIFTEIGFHLGFVALTIALSSKLGVKSPVIAHAISYGTYWAVLAIIITQIKLRRNEAEKDFK